LPQFGDGRNVEAFVWGMGVFHGWTDGNHIHIRIFIPNYSTL
jgi:hypothetical protein